MRNEYDKDGKKVNDLSYFSQNSKTWNNDGTQNGSVNSQYVKQPKTITSAVALIVCAVLVALAMLGDLISIIADGGADLQKAMLPVVIIIICIVAILRLILNIKFRKDYTLYYSYICGKPFIEVEEVASQIGLSLEDLSKDLKNAVSYKAVPQGRFSKNGKIFFITEREYEKYLNKPEKYE